MNLDEHAVVVTGAAGGMGAAVARAFADEGRHLVLSDLRPDAIDALEPTLSGAASVTSFAGDVTERDHPSRLMAACGDRKVGVLVHAAGISPSMSDGRRIFEANFGATRRLVEAALPFMARDGVVVLIASNSGQMIARPFIDRAIKKVLRGRRSLLVDLLLRNPRTAYPTSKRAVQLFAQRMSPLCGRGGVRIVSLSPGIIDTDMARLEQKAGPEMAKMVAVTPAGRTGRAEEIASVVLFLASPAASYISGTDVLVDGGCIAGLAEAGGVLKL